MPVELTDFVPVNEVEIPDFKPVEHGPSGKELPDFVPVDAPPAKNVTIGFNDLLKASGIDVESPRYKATQAIKEIQPYAAPNDRQITEAQLNAMDDAALVNYHKELHGKGTSLAEQSILSGTAMDDLTPEQQKNPFFMMAREKVMEAARQQAKENPRGVDNSPLAQGISRFARRVLDRVTGKEFDTDTQRERMFQKALSEAYAEQDPYGHAISGAVGKLLSPEMVASMVIGSPAKAAGVARQIATGAGAMTAVQTGEQMMMGDKPTPIKNAVINTAMFGGAQALRPLAEGMGRTGMIATDAIGGATGNLAGAELEAASEGRQMSGPEVAAQLVTGLAPALVTGMSPRATVNAEIRSEQTTSPRSPVEERQLASGENAPAKGTVPPPRVPEVVAEPRQRNVEGVTNTQETISAKPAVSSTAATVKLNEKPKTALFPNPKGGYASLPITYIRFGDLPQGASTIGAGPNAGKREKGVSVYEAWKDPKTGKYVINDTQGDTIVGAEGYADRPVYEVSGDEIVDVGSDGEPLLNPSSVKVLRPIIHKDVTTTTNIIMGIDGTEYLDSEIPRIDGAESTVAEPKPDDMGGAVKVAESVAPSAEAVKPTETPTVAEPVADTSEKLGPGAAKESDPTFSPSKSTSLKKAISDPERMELGLTPAEKVMREKFRGEGGVYDKAMQETLTNPNINEKVGKILDGPHAMTTDEVALVLQHKIRLRNEFNRIQDELRQANGKMDSATAEALKVELSGVSNQLQSFYDRVRSKNTTWGRGGRALQELANEGYALVEVEQRVRAAQNGDEITPETRAKLEEATNKIADAEKKVRQRQAKLVADEAKKILNRDASGQFDKNEIDREAKRLEQAIDKYITRLRDADFSPINTKGEEVPELADLRARRNDLRKILTRARADATRPSPEESALKRYKTQRANRIAELAERLVTGDFDPVNPKKPIKLDAEALKLKAEAEKWKQVVDEQVSLAKLRNQTLGQKSLRWFGEAFNLYRAFKSSFDFSAVLRQGGFFGLGNPKRLASATKEGVKAISDDYARQAEQALKARDNYAKYKESGLYLPEIGETNINRVEEHYRSRLARKIPGIGASERSYTTHLNTLRADTFDALLARTESINKLLNLAGLRKDAATTPAELKAIARAVNIGTGRGGMGTEGVVGRNFERAVPFLSHPFWSPRLTLSRFQLLAGQPLWKGSAATRTAIASEYAKFLVGTMAIYGLAKLAGAEVESDPRSSDFGKVKVGNTRYDPLGGLSQAAVLTSRLASGNTKDADGLVVPTDKIQAAGRFLRSKASPAAGIAIDVATGKDFKGDETTAAGIAKQALMPMFIEDLRKSIEAQGVAPGMASGLASMLGVGVSNYKDRPEDEMVKEIREDGKDTKLTQAEKADEVSTTKAKSIFDRGTFPSDAAYRVSKMGAKDAVTLLENNPKLAIEKFAPMAGGKSWYTIRDAVESKLDSDSITNAEREALRARLAKVK